MPLPEVPLPDVPLPELPLLVPEVPVLDVPLAVPLPEPLVEVPPLEPLCGGGKGMIPPPHPTRESTAKTKTHVLIEMSF